HSTVSVVLLPKVSVSADRSRTTAVSTTVSNRARASASARVRVRVRVVAMGARYAITPRPARARRPGAPHAPSQHRTPSCCTAPPRRRAQPPTPPRRRALWDDRTVPTTPTTTNTGPATAPDIRELTAEDRAAAEQLSAEAFGRAPDPE